ncbi:hypothetical protein GCM10010174_23620 [Kutzneria viridogrisea]|uniref:Ketosteroid isomerase-like protein n=1 Tax=Kutzneria viridogrisea TaxID=47990 RepID=A0ABR6BXD4_9PSEU|nr:ketosteroid isomerase-like protein [Kutzneria viridogrisea]
MDAKKFVENAMQDVLFGGIEDVEQAVDTYFTQDYVQHTDGHVLDRAAFVDHVRHLRARGLTEVQVQVQEIAVEGSTVADVHTVRGTKPDGTPVEVEVYMFTQLRDGKAASIRELSRLITGAAEDSDLGHAH